MMIPSYYYAPEVSGYSLDASGVKPSVAALFAISNRDFVNVTSVTATNVPATPSLPPDTPRQR
jgi:hypothetical protein